ncbi:MAG: DsbE family thiol:disulfide interchange protein [Methylomonas sp.]|nr:DsbE family thiol:disulfide interchange protein [Methylomonas sp.]PPD22903.1 MAG: DsbE family thiol:disulfide interchange protein [Methylomonas sp.]PPD27375.1 MAG: DsbE family thiol:disulfide interchange protein [Methylomonas sp.]PPD39351.1 MAG: DsbE family thiol:disulfide interchange protein [Methylomonas sp.]PPD41974.1 MAG: DsbE family thiol:disulfide interchange protein [Methylomonas sp.]
MFKHTLPLLLFIVLAVFLAIGLGLNPKEIPSPLIGKPAPAFNLPLLSSPEKTLKPDDLKGRVWLLNVWASWCVSCREEHPVLVDMVRRRHTTIIGLNYKDETAAAQRWLDHFGNPYEASVVDADGRVGIDYGVYGVPETFVIDKHGTVRYKHTGPVTPVDVDRILLPLLRQLDAEAS